MRRTASGLARPLLSCGARSSLSLGSSRLSTRYYSALSPRFSRLVDEVTADKAPTGEELANQLRAQNMTDLANNIQKLETEFERLKQPKPTTYTKDYEYVLNKLRADYAPPTSEVGKQLHALLVKYGDVTLTSPEAKAKRTHTIRTLIKIDKESDLGKKLEHYRSLPQFEDPAKQKALDQALSSVSDPAKKEQVVKDQLNWTESQRKAADLKSRHPNFKELHQALDYFPPLVDVLGEPSEFSRRFAELALDGRDPSEVNPVDLQEQTHIPSEDKLDAVYDLVALAKKETPNHPNLALIDALEKHSASESEFMAALLSESRDWAQNRLQWANEMFRAELQASEDMKKMDVDEILALHPEWAKEIEDDIVNYRWDPTIPKSEYEKAWAEYLSHYSHA